MDATITAIGDVFRKKVEKQITESYDAPTIWVDLDGNEHEDRTHDRITSKDPYTSFWRGDHTVPFYETDESSLVIGGSIKQLGSHVISCGHVYHSLGDFPSRNKLASIFKYARNLEYADSLFAYLSLPEDFIVPEDLFWNCPHLKEVHHLFRGTKIQYIPGKLFAKCPELESVSNLCFGTCIKEIPEDLFTHNQRVKDFSTAFYMSDISRIPDGLLDPFKDGIIDGSINIQGFAGQTRASQPLIHAKSEDEAKKVLAETVPQYFPIDVQYQLLGRRYRG